MEYITAIITHRYICVFEAYTVQISMILRCEIFTSLYFTLEYVLLINSPVYTHFQGMSGSSFYSSRKCEVKSVVLPPDGLDFSDSEAGASDEDIEDELYTALAN